MVPTLLAAPDWSRLSNSARNLLSEVWYVNRTNPGQGGQSNDPLEPVSVLYGPDDRRWLRLNTGSISYDKYDPKQVAALRELVDNVENNSVSVPFHPGQIVIVDNRRVMHGRPQYTAQQLPRYDGTDRWQRRLVVSQDRSRLAKYELSSRLVDPVLVFERA